MKPVRLMQMLVLAMAFVLAVAGCGREETASRSVKTAAVQRVVDGDTLVVVLDGKQERVRLIGIDTPETKKQGTPVMFYGPEAGRFTEEHLGNREVELEFDVEERDRYGRLLAYVWVDGALFNERLVREGFARMATYPPNVKYVDRFREAQREAREQGRGIWQDYEAAFGEPPEALDSK